jgi:parallel beta-helix repeat protein
MWRGWGANLIENNSVINNGTDGLVEDSGIHLFADGNTVQRNIINGNVGSGIIVTNDTAGGSFPLPFDGNLISQNSIFNNGKIGIDLHIGAESRGLGTAPYVTPNDLGDGDSGANLGQNFPVLISAVVGGGDTTITGSLNSTANTTFTIEIFSSSVADPSGNGEGETYRGFDDTVTTDPTGNVNFSIVLSGVTVPAGDWVTATATDPSNNTSEFSNSVAATTSGNNIYYVRTDGNDGNTGLGNSAAQAWRTIQKAANTMIPGDMVYVIAGTYNEEILENTSATAANPIRYEAVGNVILDGGGSDCYTFRIENADYIIIDGFEFTNYLDCGSIQANAYFNNSDYGQVLNSVFHDTGRDAIGFRGTSSDCLAFNNLIYNISDDGISPIGGGNHTLRNNTIYNVGNWAIEGAATPGNLYENNIIWENIDNTAVATYAYNDYINAVLPGTGNIQSNPLFINAAGGDFHLSQILSGQASNSPAIDAGSDTAANIGLDTRTTRTDGGVDVGTVDMGYHYPNGSPVWSVTGTVFEDADFTGAASDYDGGASDLALQNVDVELYDNSNVYITSTTTTGSGNFTFTGLGNGSYKVRARSATIGDADTLPAGGLNATVPATWPYPLADMTWGNGSAVYGGQDPTVDDTATGDDAGPGATYVSFTVSGADITSVNFGFAYNVIVNRADDANAGNVRSTQGSLRQFIKNANAIGIAGGTTANASQFRVSNALLDGNGVASIAAVAALPALNDSVGGTIIDGSTQTTNIGDTNLAGPEVELNGTGAGGGVNGLNITSGNNIIRGVAINRFNAHGISITGGATGNIVVGNYIGTNVLGTATLANNFMGVELNGAGINNRIGGTAAADRNVISGNGQNGVSVIGGSDNTVIQGNLIGLNATGTGPIPNTLSGIGILGASSITVGGNVANAGNVVSGNTQQGIWMNTSSGTIIQGNTIGLNASGNAAVANGGIGIVLEAGVSGAQIGGAAALERNLISSNNDGIFINGADNTTIEGNYIGTNAAGDTDLGNSGEGILLDNSADNTNIYNNVISGNNDDGLDIKNSTLATIQGNYIGVSADGLNPLGNVQEGILLDNSSGNTIGGTTAAERNLVSGNQWGIRLSGVGSTGNVVQGNYIGTDVNGTANIANTSLGVTIRAGAANNTIGGTAADAANLIAFNGIGILIEDAASTGNALQTNAIHSSTGLGIDLGNDGVTANDGGALDDGDGGPNNLQNYPDLTSAASGGGNTTIMGTLDSTPSTTFRVEFFSSPAADPEGAVFLGFDTVVTDVNGVAAISSVLPIAVAAADVVTATATDTTTNINDTSEFSAPVTVTAIALIELSSATDSDAEATGGNIPQLLVNGTLSAAQTIQVNVTGGTATGGGTDYTHTALVNIPAGVYDGMPGTAVSINLTINDDILVEGDETIDLQLANPSAGLSVGDADGNTATQNVHTYTISDDDAASVAFQAAASATVDETAAPHTITVVLSIPGGGTLANAVTVDAIDAGSGSATGGTDYTAFGTQTATFAAGSADGATQTVTVDVLADLAVEGNETVDLQLQNVTGPATLGAQTTHQATLTDDDAATVAFAAANSATADESAAGHNITVVLSIPGGGTLEQAVTVDAVDAGTGSATSGTDFTAFGTQTATFAAGSSDGATQTVTLSVLADTLVEGDETVDLQLQNVGGPATTGAQNTHQATITDDDTATVAFQAANSATTDEAAAGHTVTVVLTIPGGGTLEQAVTVDAVDAGTGSATSGTDFTAFGTQTATFAAGSGDGATQTVTLSVLADTLVEGDETVDLQLQNVNGPATTGAQTTHQATITDDDTATVAFQAASSATANESAANHSVTVVLSVPSGATPSDITVDVTDAGGGTATSDTDYTAVGTVTLTFAAGSSNGATQTFDLAVLADTDVEGDETVNLQLGNVTGTQATLGAQTTHTATITDDDQATVAFQNAAGATADETAGNHAVTVVLSITSGNTPSDITVDVTDTGGGSATSGTDYTAVGTVTLTFPAGSANGAIQTFNLDVLADTDVEGNETVDLQLGNVTGTQAILGAQTTHTATITDDDQATVAFQAATSTTADENIAGNHPVVVVLSVPSGTIPSAITVDVTDATGGTATSGADYTAVGTTTLAFPAGSADGAIQTFDLAILPDALVENIETVNLQLGNVTGTGGALGAQTTHTASITDDDIASVAFLSPASATTDETAGNHPVIVVLTTDGSTLGANARFRITDAGGGTATSDTDYTAVGNVNVVFPAGSGDGATQIFNLAVLADLLTEGDETVNLQLARLNGPATLGTQSTHQATITDDDLATVAFQIAGSATTDEAAANHSVTVVLSVPSGTIPADITVDLTDAGGGTATSASDYSAISTTTLTFPSGSATGVTRTFDVGVLADILVEGNETVNLQLSNVTGPGALGAQSVHTATITDDDAVTVAFQTAASATTDEIAGNHGVAVILSVPSGTIPSDITVDVTDVGGGTATSASDYSAVGTVTLTFTAGSANGTIQNFDLGILADLLVEGNETVNLQLSNVSGTGGTLGAQTTHTATITDDEAATVEFDAASSSAPEPNTPHGVAVRLNIPGGGTLENPITVEVADTLGGTASLGLDYGFASPVTVTFSAGSGDGATESADITIVDEALLEGDETVLLILQNPASPVTLDTQTSHTMTITASPTTKWRRRMCS